MSIRTLWLKKKVSQNSAKFEFICFLFLYRVHFRGKSFEKGRKILGLKITYIIAAASFSRHVLFYENLKKKLNKFFSLFDVFKFVYNMTKGRKQ